MGRKATYRYMLPCDRKMCNSHWLLTNDMLKDCNGIKHKQYHRRKNATGQTKYINAVLLYLSGFLKHDTPPAWWCFIKGCIAA